ncbi:probable ADP-ribosylation factor GTPase-activating protein AGD14 [Durio zibethinus]|uniref:Probable ADP-ribosylation factor GTPase-activating protein AGD14 n=1 Tax=Durio zibethinus TaxID=66656 RepID=A0A6P5ZAG1_DURZI|nr:probable ADP-ribosylation factor GTPase-activating protein AGD14 [Durio zibethinus]XP_022749779.1 probable ADP-ribosylation factor GTPase-activating protein AGD14 [Durio zibethinus]
MASRVKEDEKNERIIRGLLKQPENRRCINCNSLGPQYVCTNFWTFVCTTCSGIHREFTHRVKSVSLAKFTSQEVIALQEGGNQRAKEIYYKEWDPQRNSLPDSSNVERLRDFIKHVYVDRRYSGERSYDKPSRGKMGDKEDFYENRRTDGYQGGSRSPPYEDTNERRYGGRSSPAGRNDDRNFRYGYDERRSPGYDQESQQYGDYRRSPARPEVVNDWRREDRFGNGRKPEDRRISDGDPKLEGRSPERPKDLESFSPPVVRPVREILGENVIPLRISEPPKANGSRTVDGPQTQRTASSSSLGSTSGNPAEVKLETTVSLIDFDADPEPPVASAVTQTQQTAVTQSIVQPTSSTNDNNWASFDFSSQTNVSQAPSNVNTLDSVLSQLSVPPSVPGHLSGVSSGIGGWIPAPVANVNAAPLIGNSNVAFTGQSQTLPFGAAAPAAARVSNFSTLPPGALTAAPGLMPIMPVSSGSSQVSVNNAGQWPNMQYQQANFFSATSGHSTSQQFMPSPLNFAPSQHMQGPLSAPVAQTTQAVLKPVQDVTSTVASQPPPTETKASGRKELPVDLFTATYPTYPASALGWQTGPPRGMGFTMQYNTAMPMSAFPQSSRSINPFDLGGEALHSQTQTFPSMASLQGALPNVLPPTGLRHTSSFGTPSSAWMPPQSLPYAPGMPLQPPPYASAVPQRPYPGAQLPSNLTPSSHQIGGIGSEASFGFVNTDQQAAVRFSAPATPQPFSSVGGNPFG